jgi:dihydrofolate reductase
MSKLFHQTLVTVDGFMSGPNGEFDWHIVDDDFSAYLDQMLRSIDAIVLGRRTYEGLAEYWPTATEPEAGLMNAVPKYVISNTLQEATWANTTILRGDAADSIRSLKAGGRRDLALFASSELAASLVAAGLIDELRIITSPVLLGEGMPLFPKLPHRTRLQLNRSERFTSGTLYSAYAVLPEQESAYAG